MDAFARVVVCVTSYPLVDIDLIEAKVVLATGAELGPTYRRGPWGLESFSRTTDFDSWYEPGGCDVTDIPAIRFLVWLFYLLIE